MISSLERQTSSLSEGLIKDRDSRVLTEQTWRDDSRYTFVPTWWCYDDRLLFGLLFPSLTHDVRRILNYIYISDVLSFICHQHQFNFENCPGGPGGVVQFSYIVLINYQTVTKCLQSVTQV